MVQQEPLTGLQRRTVTDQMAVHRMLLHAHQRLISHTFCPQRRRHRGYAFQLHRVPRLNRRMQRRRALGFHRQHRHIAPAVALQSLDYAAEQTATAHRQHHGVRLKAGLGDFIHQAGMPSP
ncbi:hypothetical protein D3C79_924160 [compost metagenome]